MKAKSNVNGRAPVARAAAKSRNSQSAVTRRGTARNGHVREALQRPNVARTTSQAGRKACDEALQHYATLYNYAPVGYVTLDSSGAIRQINKAGASLLGGPAGKLIGLSFSSFLAGRKDRSLFSRHLQRKRVAEENEDIVTTEIHLAGAGKSKARQVQLTSRRDPAAPGCLLVAITDISSLRQAQAELGAVNERLEQRVNERTAQLATANQELHREFKQRQRMEKEMTEISEQERRSLGQELHDGICQHLTGVAMMADTLSDACQQKSLPEVSLKVKALADLIRTAANDTRNVARGLHPVEMDTNGLVSALYDLAARHKAGGQIRCRLQCSDAVPIQDNDVAMHLYRIAQQAVINASMQDQARNVVITLGIQRNEIILSIADDGARASRGDDFSEASGLSMMRHRASVIGAKLEFQSTDTGENVVRCRLPAPAFTASSAPRR